jgi:hypothetical protein
MGRLTIPLDTKQCGPGKGSGGGGSIVQGQALNGGGVSNLRYAFQRSVQGIRRVADALESYQARRGQSRFVSIFPPPNAQFIAFSSTPDLVFLGIAEDCGIMLRNSECAPADLISLV